MPAVRTKDVKVKEDSCTPSPKKEGGGTGGTAKWTNEELAAIFEAAVADVSGPKLKAVAEKLKKSDTQVRDVWRRRLHKGIAKAILEGKI
ncbi:unnamed protein product [Jaminaea pallidilutea]